MKKSAIWTIFVIIFIVAISFLMSLTANAAVMEDYCVVPPYVIQNVKPNIMLLVDTSLSMEGFAYSCVSTKTTAAGNTTTTIPVDNSLGFKVNQAIFVGTRAQIVAGTASKTRVSANNAVTNTLTVTAAVTYSSGYVVADAGCLTYDSNMYNSTTCASTTATGVGTGTNIITVNSATNFEVGEYIVVVNGGTPQVRYITAISTSDKKLTLDSATTAANSDVVKDYLCYYYNNSANPEQSFEPAKEYYGYFKPTYWYTYSSSGGRFEERAIKSPAINPTNKQTSDWDGNFLNWLTMRRFDVVRRVLTGGLYVGAGIGYAELRGLQPSYGSAGYRKIFYDPTRAYTPFADRATYIFTNSGSAPGDFYSYKYDGATSTATNLNTLAVASGGLGLPGGSATLNVAVKKENSAANPIEGVLQNAIGTRARVGLAFYSTSFNGAKVFDSVGDSSLTDSVNQINNHPPDTATPLAESLWSMTGYFAGVTTGLMGGNGTSGTGPLYNNADYGVTYNADPLNYNQGGSAANARYLKCSKNYVLILTDGEPCGDGDLPTTGTKNLKEYANPSQTAGSPFYCTSATCVAAGPFPATANEKCGVFAGADTIYDGIEDVALYAHTTDLRSSTVGRTAIDGIQNLTIFPVFAFGSDSTLLKYTAINGGFEDSNGNNIPDLQSEWDANSDGVPDTYFEANEGSELEDAIRNAINSMLKRATSGTAASVLASGEGSGANLVQAVFYPKRRFGNDIISWTGLLQNLWYYVDPFFGNSSIREDTDSDYELDLVQDYIAQLYFDTTTQTARGKRFIDSDGDGDADSQTTTVEFENLGNLWEAGNLLWQRAASDRTIYTNCSVDASLCIGSTGLMNFAITSAPLVTSPIVPLLNVTDKNANGILDEAQYAIKFVRGEELTSRDSDGDGVIDIVGIDLDLDGVDDYRNRTVTVGSDTYVWKLGDILNSTPKISSWVALNQYDKTYKPYEGNTYKDFINTDSLTPTVNYKGRGMVYAGGNDGMLHAFKLGHLELISDTAQPTLKARLTGTDLGKEMWAFIPKNVLPYLNYMGDPNYCHIYSVDLTPYLVDASIEKPSGCLATDYWDCARDVTSWRTILIGGMRYGGACKNASYTTCSSAATSATNLQTIDLNGDGSINNSDCVRTPITNGGFSSYFALDVTDQSSAPKLLWEYTHPDLGNATSGPTVVRINARSGNPSTADPLKNGRWFVVFGSGPTGPIDTANLQFLGASDQNLKLFVLDLKTGALATTNPINTTVPYAFAGSMLNASHDTDLDYQDDVVYIPYVKRVGASSPYTWTGGGILRLWTQEDLTGANTGAAGTTAINADNWIMSTLIDGIGPVTSATVRLQSKDKGQLWVYGGTGRYFYVNTTTTDDGAGQRGIFGIKDPCYSASGFSCPDVAASTRTFCATQCSNPAASPSCTTPVTCGDLTNVTDIANVVADPDLATYKGWYINTDPSGTYSYLEGATTVSHPFFAERTITDPLSTSSGIVFFTTYKPYNEECGVGGKSFIWATKYNTGGAAGALLKGMALIQVSTGAIEQLDMSNAFSAASGRKTTAMEGVPPQQQGLSLITSPPPLKRVLHIRER